MLHVKHGSKGCRSLLRAFEQVSLIANSVYTTQSYNSNTTNIRYLEMLKVS
jgi:hypothetical protein